MGRKSREKWARRESPVEPPSSPLWSRILAGGIAGGLVGVVLLGIGMLRAAIVYLSGQRLSWPEVREAIVIALLYCGAFALAGAAVSALWPLRRNRAGAYALGYIGAGIVSSIIGVIVMWIKEDRDPVAYLFTVGIMTLIFGSVFGHEISKEH